MESAATTSNISTVMDAAYTALSKPRLLRRKVKQVRGKAKSLVDM